MQILIVCGISTYTLYLKKFSCFYFTVMTPEDFAAACEECILLSTPSYKLFWTKRKFSHFNQIPLSFCQAHIILG